MTTEQSPDGYFVDLYRQYVGEPEGYTDVYVGFGLFFGGIGIGATALLLFLWGSTYEARTLESAYYDLLQPAYALGLLSLPATMLGVVVLLPSDRRTLYGAVGGAALAALAVAGFLYAYPHHWYFVGDVDYTVEVVTAYAVGLTGLVAATGAALVAHYLELASRAESPAAEDESADPDEDGGLSMADVREDIDEAMASVELDRRRPDGEADRTSRAEAGGTKPSLRRLERRPRRGYRSCPSAARAIVTGRSPPLENLINKYILDIKLII